MKRSSLTQDDLRHELHEYRERFPRLQDDELFVLWFLRAFLTENEDEAARSVCGGPHDKGVDAVLVDDDTRNVFIVQGKYHREAGAKAESRGDVLGFTELGTTITGPARPFADLLTDISPEVEKRLEEARKRIVAHDYRLQLYYVTMGRCSASLIDEAERLVRSAERQVTFTLVDGRRVLLMLSDYFDGVAPPVPSLDLEVEQGNGVQAGGMLNRYDSCNNIDSWVFSMSDDCVKNIFEQAGIRLFARNVRGFLGNTEINKGMEETLNQELEYFWYYNNGITIVCDDAKPDKRQGRDLLHVTNPQIINGQQTTRILARIRAGRSRASVIVRVICVPRKNGDGNRFETLVSQIVQATNWQNAIRPSDLMSNDRRQIDIERQIRKLGYLYIRKRQSKYEARRVAGNHTGLMIKKEELAQAVAGSDMDPAIVREGKERLFEERYYGQIFPTSDPYYYLNRYWLMRQVGYAARGYPERAYAKWLVLNFVWPQLASLVRSRSGSEAFRSYCERTNWRWAWRSINAVYIAAMKFYRTKRGKGAKVVDVSTFFQRRNLHKDFERFWHSGGNRHRSAFRKTWGRFAADLTTED